MKENFRQAIGQQINSLAPPLAAPIAGGDLPSFGAQMQEDSKERQKDMLPPFGFGNQIKPGAITLPKILIEGLLHRKSKMVLAGGSKSFKSWSLMDLALSITHGLPWWGCQCKQGKILYINFELEEGFFQQRLLTIAGAKGIIPDQNFLFWNLRGKCYDLLTLARVLQARAQMLGQVDLIVVDPIYKALGDLDENSAGDMGRLMQQIEELSDSLGAAIVFGAHFSKGSQNGKLAMDRISGSGVFSRDPDAILTMTTHEDKGSYSINSDLRYLSPLPDFVVTWDFPLMKVDETKDPAALFDPTRKPKLEKEDELVPFSIDDVLEALPHSGLIDSAWKTVVLQRFGRAGKTFYEFKGELIESGQVTKQGTRYCRSDLKLQQPS